MRPLREFNSRCSDTTRLRLPANYPHDAHRPRSKDAIRTLTHAQCEAVAEALELPPPENLEIQTKRQQIADYLGCIIEITYAFLFDINLFLEIYLLFR